MDNSYRRCGKFFFTFFQVKFLLQQIIFLFVTSKFPCYDNGESGGMEEGKFNGINNEKRVNKIIDDMTLFDDDLMSHVFDNNVEATELLLRIVLDEDIKVISVTGQDELKNPLVDGRNVTLDVHATEANGRKVNVEVQGNSKGAAVERARYHSSMVDVRMLKAKQNFSELKDSYVIFFCKRDKFREGLPIYHIERTVRETGKPFDDGSHIIYVNGSYKGEGDLAKLIEDFHQKNPANMHYKALSNGVKHFKEKEKGRETMCDSVEKFARECADEREIMTKINIAKDLIKDEGFSLDQVLRVLKIGKNQQDYFISQVQK